MSERYSIQSRHYQLVAQAIAYISSHARSQPSLTEVAAAVNLNEYHLQRVFTEWAGVSPKRFLQFLTKQHARQALRCSADLLSATLDAGLSSPGRLHDLMVSCEAMTPGEVKTGGLGVTVNYGNACTPFGTALIGWTTRGVCYLAFDHPPQRLGIDQLAAAWPAAELARDDQQAGELVTQMFAGSSSREPIKLLLRGTNFQLKVWEALLDIRPGQLVSYSQVARVIGSPNAQRSVGSAIAANSIGFLIPCHRVIRDTGELTQYRWGTDRKRAMQAWEAATVCSDAALESSTPPRAP